VGVDVSDDEHFHGVVDVSVHAGAVRMNGNIGRKEWEVHYSVYVTVAVLGVHDTDSDAVMNEAMESEAFRHGGTASRREDEDKMVFPLDGSADVIVEDEVAVEEDYDCSGLSDNDAEVADMKQMMAATDVHGKLHDLQVHLNWQGRDDFFWVNSMARHSAKAKSEVDRGKESAEKA